jgi:hypothetical protein
VIFSGTWAAIKRGITERQRTKRQTPWKLIEFIWRRKHDDWWSAILRALREVRFDLVHDGRPNGRLVEPGTSAEDDPIVMDLPRFTDFSDFEIGMLSQC